HHFSIEDLTAIEDQMNQIIAFDFVFEKKMVSKEEAVRLFEQAQEPYKVEILEGIPDAQVSLYQQGDFLDLCRGPHLERTGQLKAFKLLSVAGAYWRGDEKRKMLQRIYGTAFLDKKTLRKYLDQIEEAKKRDHRKLGKQLGLISVYPEAGAGLVFWNPKGGKLRWVLEEYWRKEHERHGYDFVFTPHVARRELWVKSGHWDYYRENMYPPMDLENESYVVKPMNCPGHILIYQSDTRSYRDLPIRYFELGTVYRYERSGVLHGAMRVRGFTQDDAHIFCTPDQLRSEIVQVLNLIDKTMKLFDFHYEVALSTRPEKYVGTIENWTHATEALSEALKERAIPFKEDPGEGVFYGPKIDIKLVDALGRKWQGPTVQVDFNLPERFGATYVGSDGKHHSCVMVHRAIFGSMERFMGILIEHYAGAFPLWLSPVQILILPITDADHEYASEVSKILSQNGIRLQIDGRNEKIGFRIREAQLQKIPYMLIVGEKERTNKVIAVRDRKKGDLGTMSIDDFLLSIKEELIPGQ
ncbi:MAG: threonine--tRNA ligase, partial [Chlamydiota bacterium]|nr:threonine--tRNA ligase [Chlamydiota bacterium]